MHLKTNSQIWCEDLKESNFIIEKKKPKLVISK